MKAIILGHPADFKKFDNKDNSLNFYAYNFYTYQVLKKVKKIKYIDNNRILNKYGDFSQKITSNWFKKNRIKNLKFNKISVGNIILPSLINEYSNNIKNYLLIQKILQNNSKVFFPHYNKIIIKDILQLFPTKIKFYNSNNRVSEFLSINQVRSKIISLPRIHKYSTIARFIQSIFFSINKNKTIYYPDPRTKFFFYKFRNILYLNSLKFWKSYYFNYSTEYLKKAKNLIDLNYENDLKKYLSQKKTKQNGLFLKIFENTLNSIVKKNNENIIRTLAIYMELFDYYKPRALIFPGILNFDYAAAIEISKIKKIKTFIAPDGVLTNYDQTEFNKNYIFNKIIAWGNENKILLQKHNIKKKDIILSSTFYKRFNQKIDTKKKYVIVLPLMHYSQKVSSQADKNIYHTINILKVLNKLNEQNIILKLKEGNYNTNNIKFIYYKYILKNKLQNITIKLGKLENYLSDTKFIIGQCSSTIYEVVKNNIKYHIYEPYDLGLSDKDIKNSQLFNRKSISRNKKELFINLQKKNYSSLIKNNIQIFKAKELREDFFND